MQERRRHARVQAKEPARILFSSCSLLACKIRDVSAGGACLEVDIAAVVPDEFDLIPNNSDPHACRVVWRIKDRIGVAFQE
jgi:hypothetical protein